MLRIPMPHFGVKLSRNATLRLCLAVALCAAVAGCGRRGTLEYPVDPNDPQVRDSGLRIQTERNGQKVIRGYVIPDKKFALDPLL